MNENINLDVLVDKIEECSQNLTETNLQMQTLYGVMKGIKNPKNREEAMHVYKQAYDALGEHIKSFSNLTRVVREQVDDVEHPQRKK